MNLGQLDRNALVKMDDAEFRSVLTSMLNEQKRDRRENQLVYYQPASDKAMEVHESNAKVLGIGGGNGSGKTETALVEMMMLATGVIPDSLAGVPGIRERMRGPVKCRVICESLTTVLHPIILPKLKWWEWSGVSFPGGDKGHYGWVPRDCLIGSSWEKSWSEKFRMLRVYHRNPDQLDEIQGESTIQFMCVRGDQHVLMEDGRWVQIQKVSEGDRVAVDFSESASVSKVHHYKNAPLKRIKLRGGSRLYATPNHKHVMSDGSIRTTEKLVVGDHLSVGPIRNPRKDDPWPDWKLGWLGIGLGDGSLTGKQFNFTAKSPSRVLSDLPNLPPNCKIINFPSVPERFYVTLIHSRRDNPLVGFLKDVDIWGKKSQEKFIPEELFRQPDEQIATFLHHIWNTDGTVNVGGRQAVYISTSQELAMGVKYLLWGLGIGASCNTGVYWSEFAGKKVRRYQTVVSGAGFDRFTDAISNLELIWRPAKRHGLGVIRSIEDADPADVYCLEVDHPRHTFVVDGIVTHNSKDQDASDFASGDFHFVLFDEPPTYAIWRENEARTMRVNGRMMLAMTWPDDPSIPVDWLFTEIYDKAQPGPNKVKDVDWINIWTTDNMNLDQSAVKTQAETWPDSVRDVRIYGKPIRFSNRIHPLFTPNSDWWCFSCGKVISPIDGKCMCGAKDILSFTHVGSFDSNSYMPTIWVLDPHPRKAHMFAWIQIGPDDCWWVIREGMVDGDPRQVREFCDKVETDLGLSVVRRLIDPFMGRSPASSARGVTWQDEFDRVGLTTDLAQSSEVANQVGRSRINELLIPDPSTRRPRLIVHSLCERTIFQMTRYVWDDYRQALEKDQKQKPKEKNDDFPTILRYLANSEPTFRNLVDGTRVVHRNDKRTRLADGRHRNRIARAPSYAGRM